MVVVFLVPVLAGIGVAQVRAVRRSTSPRSLTVVPFVGDSGRARHGGHAAAREHVPGPARARHPDADGAAVRRRASCCCCGSSSPSGCCASSRCPTSPTSSRRCSRRSRRCCRRSGRARRCSPACRAAATAAHRGAVDDGAGARSSLVGGRLRALALRRLQQGAGGAQGALHAVARCSTGSRALLPLSPVRRHLLVKDLKVFLRDVSQWSQLLLLLALVLRVSLQLPRARSRSHPVHERRASRTSTRSSTSAMAGLRDGDGGGALRVSGGVGRRARRSGSSAPRRSRCATSCGRSSGPGWCRCCVLTEMPDRRRQRASSASIRS